MQEIYPLRLKGMYMVEAPIIIGGLMKLIKPFMSKKMRSRMHIMDRKALYKLVDPAELPEIIGGSWKCKERFFSQCERFVDAFGDKMFYFDSQVAGSAIMETAVANLANAASGQTPERKRRDSVKDQKETGKILAEVVAKVHEDEEKRQETGMALKEVAAIVKSGDSTEEYKAAQEIQRQETGAALKEVADNLKAERERRDSAGKTLKEAADLVKKGEPSEEYKQAQAEKKQEVAKVLAEVAEKQKIEAEDRQATGKTLAEVAEKVKPEPNASYGDSGKPAAEEEEEEAPPKEEEAPKEENVTQPKEEVVPPELAEEPKAAEEE